MECVFVTNMDGQISTYSMGMKLKIVIHVRNFMMIQTHFQEHMPSVTWSWDSTVGIANGYRLDDREVRVRVPVGSRIFTSPCCPDHLWSPPSLLSNGYWG
jgi:hypothetical protein